MKKIIFILLLLSTQFVATPIAMAAADIAISSPAVASIRASMHARHEQLKSLYASGAVGLTRDGLVGMHDASVVPLKDRQNANALIAAENDDRNALYKEIANANGHPEWKPKYVIPSPCAGRRKRLQGGGIRTRAAPGCRSNFNSESQRYGVGCVFSASPY